MSLTLTRAVWDRSQQSGAALLVLLALADFANRQGLAWPRLDALATRVRMSRRYCTALLQILVASGEVTIESLPGDRRRRLYRLEAFLGWPAAGHEPDLSAAATGTRASTEDRLRAEWAAIARRATPPPFELEKRLEVLADLLPPDLPGRSRWHQQLLALEGELDEVEDQLGSIELELLDELAAGLEPEEQHQLRERSAAALRRHRSRLTEEQLQHQQQQLFRRLVRQRYGLVRLSLFAPQVEDALNR